MQTIMWRHNGCDGVSNHQPHDCLLNRPFRRRSKKTSKLRVTGLCEGNSPVTGEFPSQVASNAENVSIWWPCSALYGCWCDAPLRRQAIYEINNYCMSPRLPWGSNRVSVHWAVRRLTDKSRSREIDIMCCFFPNTWSILDVGFKSHLHNVI